MLGSWLLSEGERIRSLEGSDFLTFLSSALLCFQGTYIRI